MFVADTINFREIVMKESLPLVTIQNAVVEFLRGRTDAVLFGAQAVNVYVNEPRATQDVDLMSTRAAGLAGELRAHLSQLFHIAVRVREIKAGLGYRIFQLRKTGNRHLVDIRSVNSLPQTQIIDGIQVMLPAELIASKVISSGCGVANQSPGPIEEIWSSYCWLSLISSATLARLQIVCLRSKPIRAH